MAKLSIAGNVQSGESLGETAVYNAMWLLAKEDQWEGGKVTSKVISIGWKRIARAASVSWPTAKKNCLSLIEKLNLKKIGEHDSVACKGTQYRIYSYPQILSRRRKAGLTH
jgi:hypothetical protein